MNHQHVDIIAFRTHHLGKVCGSKEDEGIEAKEVAGKITLIDTAKGDG